jgi:hypothetical protein
MQFLILRGTIDRRILVNFRVDPDVLSALLPAPFRPQLVGGWGVAGICLIRLRGIGPAGWPKFFGFSSENAAHRIAVEWDDGDALRTGVYVPRRDTSSWFNVVVGGRLFPGMHHFARFQVRERGDEFELALGHRDGTRVEVAAHMSDAVPADSVFGSLDEASAFFSRGSLGYSATRRPGLYEGLELHTHNWKIEPLAVGRVASSFFDNRSLFPAGSVEFDSAFLMRGIEHEWRGRESICCADDNNVISAVSPTSASGLRRTCAASRGD